MLTRDLLRYRVVDGRLEPWLLRPTAGVRELAGQLLEVWHGAIGRHRGELEERLVPALYRGRSLQVARGLSRIIEEACRFDDPASMQDLRQRALACSADLLKRDPHPSPVAHRRAVAAALGCDAEDLPRHLYGDLPDAAILRSVDIHEADTVIARYNTGLCQGLLLQAQELSVRLIGVGVGRQRALLKAVRFRRLLATVHEADGEDLELRLAGPGSVLDQNQRYGQQLALLLPAIACLPAWRLEARLAAPTRDRRQAELFTMTLDDSMGLAAESRYLSQVPEELTLLADALSAAHPEWQVEAEAVPYPIGDGTLLVPDLRLEVAGQVILLECFHRWHAPALRRRLDHVAARPQLPVIMGVDRALAGRREIAPWLEEAGFHRRGFLYASYPGVRLVTAAVRRYLTETD